MCLTWKSSQKLIAYIFLEIRALIFEDGPDVMSTDSHSLSTELSSLSHHLLLLLLHPPPPPSSSSLSLISLSVVKSQLFAWDSRDSLLSLRPFFSPRL